MSNRSEELLTAKDIDYQTAAFRVFLENKTNQWVSGQLDDQVLQLSAQIRELSTDIATAGMPQLHVQTLESASDLQSAADEYVTESQGLSLADLVASRLIYKLTQQISAVRDQLGDDIGEAWDEFTANHPVPTYAHLAPLASRHLKASEEVALQSGQPKMERLARKSVPEAADVESYFQTWKRLTSLVATLQKAQDAEVKAAGNSPEVTAFKNAVAKGGAPIGLLTKEVLEWMTATEITDDYEVVCLD